MTMEVFQTETHYIFLRKERSLWWNRYSSEFQLKCGWDLSSVDDIECIGVTHGIVGTIALQGVLEPHLIVIKEVVPVGVLYAPHLVYKIKSIAVLGPDGADTLLLGCNKHSTSQTVKIAPAGNSATAGLPESHPSPKSRLFESSALVNKTWGAVKSAGSTIRNTTEKAAAIATSQVKSTVNLVVKADPVRIEKRVLDELHKIFDETDSFYYSPNCDITNNLQRRGAPSDDRFYWNRPMLADLLKVVGELQEVGQGDWVLPIIQGFVQVEQCVIGNECFTLALVSRRSRNRAGTRYKRRGVDEHGNCANYVETEQVLSLRQHQISFTQVRGSVPVYWSQPGYKYRPPPRLDRDEPETQHAFEKHFNGELQIYQSICIINLVEQSGKEKIIGDAYANHVLKYNSDQLIYVTFDFHEYCRGMRFENVSSLIESLAPEAGAMGFHWRDNNGPICNQKGVFRVNCMDCLDRTNVVQTAIGKAVLESQLVKLGLAMPYSQLPDALKAPFMVLWANNGDVISRQYAGTNALKGDYTRTGERKISGIMKDGMNSANRYYIQHFADTFRQSCIDLLQGQLSATAGCIPDDDVCDAVVGIAVTALKPAGPVPLTYYNYGQCASEHLLLEQVVHSASYYLARFKDTYRQATIDMMLGNNVSPESVSALGGSQTAATDETDALEGAEHARLLVEDCRRLLLGTAQLPVGAWGLIDADPSTGDPSESEVDTILILTDDCYIVAEYDSHLDKIVRFENVPLASITLIELGLFQHSKMFQGPAPAHLCIRLNYAVDGVDGYFHMFRSPNIRFFNNVAVVIRKTEEITESLTAIVDLFRIALQNCGRSEVAFQCGGSLQRRKSRTLLSVPAGIPRNLSESQLVQMGSKAFSNMAGQFSKIGQSINASKIGRGTKGGKKGDECVDPATRSGRREGSTGSVGSFGGSATAPIGGSGGSLRPSSAYAGGKMERSSSESEEAETASIYEPEDLVEQNPLYNENVFLPSVGIVMGGTSSEQEASNVLVEKDSFGKMSSDLSTMSISSVTDHINMPVGMLECASPIRVSSPTPEIFVDGTASGGSDGDASGGRPGRNMMSLNLQAPGSGGGGAGGSDNALRQLKKLTSPLSNIGKGLQTLGANLDPRKIAVKSPVAPVRSTSAAFAEIKQLEEKWEKASCRTKLIAL
uniref:SAC domain-containing protein n=1 Tax=Anopheles christyi TaxID=43041 RepID=A0A182K2C3_9DIPT